MSRFKVWCGVVLAGAVGLSSGVSGLSPAAAAKAASTPAKILTLAKAMSPIAPGAQAIVDLTIWNKGESAADAPVEFAVSGMPEGMSLLGATSALEGRRWTCAPTSCTLSSTGGPVELPAGEIDSPRVRFAVAAGTTVAAKVSLGFAVTSPGANLAGASTKVEVARLATGVPGSLEVVGDLDPLVTRQLTTLTLKVASLGPATIGGTRSTVTVKGLVPPGASDVSASGAGWTCTQVSGSPQCSWAGSVRAIGSGTNPLTVRFRAPPKATASGKPVTWTRKVTAVPTGGGTAMRDSAALAQAVLAATAPAGDVFATAPMRSVLARGGSADVIVGMAGSGFTDATRTVSVKTTLPAGWTFAGDTTSDPWACATAGSVLTCTRPADFAGVATSSTSVRLRSSAGTRVGEQRFSFTGSISGAGVAAPTTTSVTLAIVDGAVAVSALRLSRFSATGSSPVDDGAPFTLTTGAQSPVGVAVENVGGASIPAGTVLRMTVGLPAGASAVSLPDGAKKPVWACTSAATPPRVLCSLTLAKAVPVAGTTPRLKLGVMIPGKAIPGQVSLPVALTATVKKAAVTSLAAATDVAAVLVAAPAAPKPGLTVSAEVTRSVRVGAPVGLVALAVRNSGSVALRSTRTTTLTLPAPLTTADRRKLPKGCRYAAGRVPMLPTLTCRTAGKLSAGGADPAITVPVRAPATAGVLPLAVRTTATGVPTATTVVNLQVLPKLIALATATPNPVTIPPDASFPVPAVQLDGRASTDAGSTARWSQEPAKGEPQITFTGVAAGQPISGLTASFLPPRVSAPITLHLRLTLTGDTASASQLLAVLVQPSLSAQPSAASARKAKPGFGAASVQNAVPGSTGSGSWTVSAPDVSKNDVDAEFPDNPVAGSRVRYLADPSYGWNGPGAVPTNITVTHQWRTCSDVDPTDCTFDDGAVLIPTRSGPTLDVLVTVSGTDSAGAPVATTTAFPLGEIRRSFAKPTLLVPPTISGTVAVGSTLTGRDGEWSLEFRKDRQWLRCSGNDLASCSDIAGATALTYVVVAADAGNALRLRVTANNAEGQPSLSATVVTSALRAGAMVNCGTTCYTWSVNPTKDTGSAGSPTPVTTRQARLIGNGTFAWNDPTAAPANVADTVAWFECNPAAPASCTQRATGRTYTPPTAGVNLEARLTLSGVAEDGSTRSSTLTVPFGTVQDVNAPPVKLTDPSISGDSPPFARLEAGNILTADPGTYAYASGAAPAFSWLRCQAGAVDACVPTGSTGSTYKPVAEDLTFPASVLRVQVSVPGFVNPATARSAPTAPVTGFEKRAVTAPTIDAGTGGPRVGAEASAMHAVFSENPATVSGPTVAWQSCPAASATNCVDLAGATSLTYTPAEVTLGRFLRVRSTIVGQVPSAAPRSVDSFSGFIGPVMEATVPVTASTDLPGGTTEVDNGVEVVVTGSGTGRAPLSFSWAQTSGDPVLTAPVADPVLRITTPATGTGLLGFLLTVTDAVGNTATSDITITYGALSDLCKLAAQIKADPMGLKTATYGDFEVRFINATVSGEPCDADTTISIPVAVVRAFGWITLSQAALTVAADGITINGGQVGLATGTAFDQTGLANPNALVIGLDPADGIYTITGALSDTLRPGLLNLPSRWAGASRLTLAVNAGVQTLSFAGAAWDSTFGAPTPVPGDLPTPPTGSAVVRISGSVGTDKTFSFALSAAGLVKFRGTGIDFAGSITRSASTGPVVFTASAALTNAVDLATGVRLESASLAWDGTTFFGIGAVTLTVNGRTLAINAAFMFTDPNNWQTSLSAAGTGTWTPIDGLRLTAPSVTGTLRRSDDGSVTLGFTLKAAAVDIAGGVRLTSPQLTVQATCAAGACPISFAFTTGLTLSTFGTPVSSFLSGSLDSAGVFRAQVDIGALTVTSGLSADSVMFSVEGGGTSALKASASANVFVLGTPTSLRIDYSDRGAIAVVEIGDFTPFPRVGKLSGTSLIFSSYAGTVTVGGEEVTVPANSLRIAATATAPKWFTDLTKGAPVTAKVRGAIGLSPLTLDLSLQFTFDDLEVFTVAGVTLTVDQVTFALKANGLTFSSTLDADATLSLPSINGAAPSVLPINLALFFDSTSFTIGGSISLRGSDPATAPVWEDAFGVPDLDIRDVAISVGFGGSGVPSLGFAGKVTLPPSFASQIGLATGVPVTLAASIAGPSSCFGIEVGTPGSSTTVLDVANLKTLTAKHAAFYIAPTGCTIGSTSIAPGLTLDFDGAILGLDVRARVAVTPSPLSIAASLELGTFTLKGVEVRNAKVAIAISPGARSLRFGADANVLGASVSVAGNFAVKAGVSTVDFTGIVAAPNLGGFKLKKLAVTFRYVSAPQSLSVDAQLDVDILGAPQRVDLSFALEGGRLTRANGSANIEIPINTLLITGTGKFAFSLGSFPTISITGSALVEGRNLTTVSADLKPGSLEFSADLNLPGVFTSTPRLSGVIAWASAPAGLPQIRRADGSLITASPGDFRFDATNIGLGVSGFDLNANVGVGRVSGVFFANIATDLNFGLGQVDAAVKFKGSVASNGDVSLSGSGAASIFGSRAIELEFDLVRAGGVFALSGAGSIVVPNLGTVEISGSFSRGATGTLYSLTGRINVNTAGYNFGSAEVTLSRGGMVAKVALNLPDLVSGNVNIAIFSSGNLQLGGNVATTGKLASALGNATAQIYFRSSDNGTRTEFTFSISVQDVLKVPGAFTLKGSISSDGKYDVTADVSAGPWSDQRDLFFCTGSYSASGTLKVRIAGGGGTSLRIDVTIEADVKAGCGEVTAGVGAAVTFTFVEPATFGLSIQLRLSFGSLGTWRPTVFSA